MSFVRGDTCYILENNMNVRAAKVINRQGKFYIIQLVGSCGAIRLCRQPPLTVIRAILSGQTGTSPAINRYAAKGSLHE